MKNIQMVDFMYRSWCNDPEKKKNVFTEMMTQRKKHYFDNFLVSNDFP